ncbi:unnamed protein product [Rotaria socialis]|uniref:Uncharacterized protein n=1 Tax=Rotaria socialis TaxID=392032 RepID=A0A817W9F8_9BILA|nr:unnamed protein product [Rotaria socialis]
MYFFRLKIRYIAEHRRTLANARLNSATRSDQRTAGVSPSAVQLPVPMALWKRLSPVGIVSKDLKKKEICFFDILYQCH